MAIETNPHAYKTTMVPAGCTWIETYGMATDHFGPNEAQQVTNLLTKHGIQGHVVVRETGGRYYLLRTTDLPTGFTPGADLTEDEAEEVEENAHMPLVLNLDDESVFETEDSVIPPAFMKDLLRLLQQTISAHWQQVTIEETILSVARKGYAIIDDDASPVAWAEYEELLDL